MVSAGLLAEGKDTHRCAMAILEKFGMSYDHDHESLESLVRRLAATRKLVRNASAAALNAYAGAGGQAGEAGQGAKGDQR